VNAHTTSDACQSLCAFFCGLLQQHPTSWIEHVKQRSKLLAKTDPAFLDLPTLVQAEYDRLKALHVLNRHGPPRKSIGKQNEK
jgi:hypothetical protein